MSAFPVRKLLAMPADLAERITAYRYDRRIPSESEAIRRLIKAALKRHEAEKRHEDTRLVPPR